MIAISENSCRISNRKVYNINVDRKQQNKNKLKGDVIMKGSLIQLNNTTSCVYLPEDDCYQVIEFYENSYYCYYMDREEIMSQFGVEL